MRNAFLVVTLAVSLAACSGGSDTASPSETPSVATSTPPQVQGPAAPSAGQQGQVPAGAFVSASDLGPGWTAASPLPPPCPARYTRTAVRSAAFREQRGTLTETLATGVDVTAAVQAWRSSLTACRYAVQDDPLGDAGLLATSADGQDALVVTGTEEVLVVLHAHGALAAARDELDGWADLALGTSCVAAPDGCH